MRSEPHGGFISSPRLLPILLVSPVAPGTELRKVGSKTARHKEKQKWAVSETGRPPAGLNRGASSRGLPAGDPCVGEMTQLASAVWLPTLLLLLLLFWLPGEVVSAREGGGLRGDAV